jgi:hypothetical protein
MVVSEAKFVCRLSAVCECVLHRKLIKGCKSTRWGDGWLCLSLWKCEANEIYGGVRA